MHLRSVHMNFYKFQVLSDYKTPAEKDFSRGFEMVLASTTAYLEACRPISVSMFNALKHLKWLLSQLPNTVSDNEVVSCVTV